MSTLGRIHRRVNSTHAVQNPQSPSKTKTAPIWAVYEGLTVSAGSIMAADSRP